MKAYFRKNLMLWLTLLVLTFFFVAAARGMETKDWVITLLRGLSVGSVTFLVASGFSLIFGLLDVLNLAHGTLFMIGAYIAWSVYVRPDTFVDILAPVMLVASGFTLSELWMRLSKWMQVKERAVRALPWAGLLLSALILLYILPRYPVSIWDVGSYGQSPVTFSFMADQGVLILPPGAAFEAISPVVVTLGLLLASMLAAFSISLFGRRGQSAPKLRWQSFIGFAVTLGLGLVALFANDAVTAFLTGLDTTWLFFISLLVAALSGALLGGLMESTLIRPLYSRPIYQLMLTLGLSAIGIEIVRAIWGRPEFVMPKPSLFSGTGDGCPATSLAG